MTTTDRQPTDEVPTDDLGRLTELFVLAFNAGDQDTIERMYSPDAVSVWKPGEPPLAGDARRANVAEFLAMGLPMRARTKGTYVNGDTALVIVDWEISGTSTTGEEVHLSGTGTDVLRRGRDGRWRYIIDNAYGGSAA
ncbi:YybH family protein [Umezawaea sp. NPDC059074]|uniref:YybH family protein n=1 Tax=Umezawaea sp. NPDC059074 TaxID=3346716 RepID=UPI0036CD7DEE